MCVVVRRYIDYLILLIPTPLVSVLLHHYTTARQYRGLITNSGTPSFLVGTHDIGPHEIS